MPGVDPLDAGRADAGHGKDSRSALPRRGGWLAGTLLSAVWPAAAFAQEARPALLDGRFAVGTSEVVQLAMFLGITGAAMLSAILLIRERARTAGENVQLRGRVAELDNGLQRAESLLNLRDQRILVWFGDERKPDLIGGLGSGEAPEDRATFMAFGKWLVPHSAGQLERAIAALREGRRAFDLVLETNKGALREAQGRVAANNAVVRFLSLSAVRREHAELRLEHQQLRNDHENLLGLIGSLDMPAWLRGADGRG